MDNTSRRHLFPYIPRPANQPNTCANFFSIFQSLDQITLTFFSWFNRRGQKNTKTRLLELRITAFSQAEKVFSNRIINPGG